MTASRDDLPPALPSMWRVLKLGYRHERWLLVAAFGLSQIAALPDALLALWLKLLGEGLLQEDRGRVLVAAVALQHAFAEQLEPPREQRIRQCGEL